MHANIIVNCNCNSFDMRKYNWFNGARFLFTLENLLCYDILNNDFFFLDAFQRAILKANYIGTK